MNSTDQHEPTRFYCAFCTSWRSGPRLCGGGIHRQVRICMKCAQVAAKMAPTKETA